MALIGITGRAQSGKDTVADWLKDEHGYRVFAFADPIYEMVDLLARSLGHNFLFTGTARSFWSDYKNVYLTPEFSVRRALQTLGTDWGRHQSPDIWIRAMDQRVRSTPPEENIVIPDVRFDNEVRFVHRFSHSRILRIERPDLPDLGAAWKEHESEMQRLPFDHMITNDGTVNDLRNKADELLKELFAHERKNGD